MSNSSNRTKDYETGHHITSRIAHKVHFLQDEDVRNDLIEMIRRAAIFTGVKLIGWCVMANHFHILAFLPFPEPTSEEEVVRRYGILKGMQAAKGLEEELAKLRISGEAGEVQATARLDSLRKRMYSIGSFMKIVKQWFTEEYNRRNGHKGTLWEGVYYDRVLPYERKPIEKCLGYIHLNPIRAAACTAFDGYIWSSYSAFKKCDRMAIDGMRFVYDQKDANGNEMSLDEIATRHEELLGALLEEHKLRMAEDIARKRAAGQNPPLDPLTTEALIAQAEAHLKEIDAASMVLREQRNRMKTVKDKFRVAGQEILTLVELHPGIRADQLMELLGVSKSALYRLLSTLKEQGLVVQEGKGGGLNKPSTGKQV